jgi:chloramphenicol-sensitive protein RarD
MNGGLLSAIGAYTLWGILPVYWKSIRAVPALEVVCHRTVWSLVFLLVLLLWRRRWEWLQQAIRDRVTLITFLVTTSLLGLNWFVYIWAVNAGHIVDASLGYFINPLISVLLGMVFLGERLRPWQWAAIGLAFGGVVFLTLGYGAFPWIALTLATSFGLYGLLRKTAALGSTEGLSLEMAILSIPCLAYLITLEITGTASFGHTEAMTSILLALTGVITAFPLIMFAYAARQVTLATVGILQYIAPTLQFLLGVLVYGETFTRARLLGYGAIWVALLVYSAEGLIQGQRQKTQTLSAG